MRTFLPITGPGGRALTPKEKIALALLAITLIVCVLTMIAGEQVFVSGTAQNPVFELIAIPSRLLGGGVLAIYAIVLLWSSLLYWRGERAVELTGVGGKVFAAFGLAVGISGALGVAGFSSAGTLGGLVGHSVANALGATVGYVVLLGMGAVSMSLAAQGAISATGLQGRTGRTTASSASSGPTSGHTSTLEPLDHGAILRGAGDPPLPDDGDPSPEARSLAVTQAMEEIERSQGIRIVEIDPPLQRSQDDEIESDEDVAERGEQVDLEGAELEVTESAQFPCPTADAVGATPETPESIGETVESAPAPAAETEEGEVQRALSEIDEFLSGVSEPSVAGPTADAVGASAEDETGELAEGVEEGSEVAAIGAAAEGEDETDEFGAEAEPGEVAQSPEELETAVEDEEVEVVVEEELPEEEVLDEELAEEESGFAVTESAAASVEESEDCDEFDVVVDPALAGTDELLTRPKARIKLPTDVSLAGDLELATPEEVANRQQERQRMMDFTEVEDVREETAERTADDDCAADTAEQAAPTPPEIADFSDSDAAAETGFSVVPPIAEVAGAEVADVEEAGESEEAPEAEESSEGLVRVTYASDTELPSVSQTPHRFADALPEEAAHEAPHGAIDEATVEEPATAAPDDEPVEAEAIVETPQADGITDADDAGAPDPATGDPYARPGLLNRLNRNRGADGAGARPYASFDWRGRPLD